MYLQEKEEKLRREKEEQRLHEAITGSEDDDSHLTVKISGDSAYGRFVLYTLIISFRKNQNKI